jgi:hypothetical protein
MRIGFIMRRPFRVDPRTDPWLTLASGVTLPAAAFAGVLTRPAA